MWNAQADISMLHQGWGVQYGTGPTKLLLVREQETWSDELIAMDFDEVITTPSQMLDAFDKSTVPQEDGENSEMCRQYRNDRATRRQYRDDAYVQISESGTHR